MIVLPAGIWYPLSWSSVVRCRATTGTTEYFRSVSCMRVEHCMSSNLSREDPSLCSLISNVSAICGRNGQDAAQARRQMYAAGFQRA